MAKYSPKKGLDEIIVTLADLDIAKNDSDDGNKITQNTTLNAMSTKAKNFFKFEKEKIILATICIVVIALATTITVISVTKSENNRANTIEITQSKDYSTDMTDKSDVESRLSDYTKTTDDNGYITYTKDNITIEVSYDNNGKIKYSRYENNLPSDTYSKVKNFDDSMIDIGMKKDDVLDILKGNNYIYHLLATNDDGNEVEIYRYGWNGEKELVSLTFINGELNNYSINSEVMEGDANVTFG
jgi:hypothetical protein